MSDKHILIVEDEMAIREMVKFGLSGNYSFSEAASLAEAQQFLAERRPNLILLDWMLPDGNGLRLLETLRKTEDRRDIPVLMLTARSGETDIVRGLDSGADDYLTKPFSIAELASRIKALLRRVPDDKTSEHLSWQDIHINLTRFDVFYQNQPVALKRREYNLLKLFIAQPGKVFTREQLLNEVWGEETDISDRAVDVSIRRLRKSFEDLGYDLPIATIRGVGYRLN